MNDKFKLYWIDMKYVRDLSKKDDHVLSVAPQSGKEDRPFLGIVVPVDEMVLTAIDIKIYKNDNKKTKERKILRTKELDWCQKNSDMIKSHAKRLYEIAVKYPKKNIGLVKRCCKFDVLEGVLEKQKQ